MLGGEEDEGPFHADRPVLASLNQRPRKLWRVSDALGSLDFDIVKERNSITRSDLDSNDVFLFDAGTRVWV
jgi:gelsolin